MLYVANAIAVTDTDVNVDYNIYIGNSLDAAKNAASKEFDQNPNAHSVRMIEWDAVSKKNNWVEIIYRA